MTALGPLRKHRFVVFFAPCLKLFECVCELAVPFIVRYVIDDCLSQTSPDIKKVLLLCLLMLGLAVFGFSMTMITQYLASKTASAYAKDLREQIFVKLGLLSSYEIDEYGKNKIVNLLSDDCKSMQNGVAMFMRLIWRAPLVVIGSVIASFFLNLTAGVVVAIALSLCSLVLFLIAFFTPKFYLKIVSELDRLSELAEDGIVGNRLIKGFGLSKKRKEEFERQSDAYQKLAYALARVNALINPLTFLFVDLAIIFICYFGSYKKAESGLSVGDIVAVISYLTTSLAALVMFARLTTSLSKAIASKRRIDAFFLAEPRIKEGTVDEAASSGHYFELQHVGVSFGGKEKALDDISFYIEEGESIGVFGGTGSGKTLIASLFERFLDPSQGKVLYRGSDIKDLKFESFRKEIALVSQKRQLFSGTIKENLCLGKNIEEKILINALNSACCDFVFAYDEGLNHCLEEAGNNLSGGQKQRLMLARAIASGRPFIIMDDSMSALDYATEKQVRDNVKNLHRTTLLFSSRPTSLKDCDRIIVLDKGRICGIGTYEELSQGNELFKNARSMQESSL